MTSNSKDASGHPLKNLSAAEEAGTGRAKAFTTELKAALRGAIRLWRDHRTGACAPEPCRERGRLIRKNPRGAVIARKVSHCSRNECGAWTQKVMKSITATLALRGRQVSSALAGMSSGRPRPQAVAR